MFHFLNCLHQRYRRVFHTLKLITEWDRKWSQKAKWKIDSCIFFFCQMWEKFYYELRQNTFSSFTSLNIRGLMNGQIPTAHHDGARVEGCRQIYCDTSCLPSPREPGSLVFLEGGDAVSDCRFLWSAVTRRIPRERVTEGGGRGGSNAALVTLNAA